MDCYPSALSKKRRISSNISIPVIEYKREFNLPHKYPSTVSSKYNSMLKNNRAVATTDTEVQSSFNESRKANIVSANNIKKLRIKTRYGRDLGEVKVQFLSQNNMLNSKKIIYHTKVDCHKTTNPIDCSLMPLDEINGIFNDVNSQNCKVPSQLIVRSVLSKELPVVMNNTLPEVKTKKNMLQKHYILVKINTNNTVFVLSQDGHKLLYNIPSSEKADNSEKTNLLIVGKKKLQNLLVKGGQVSINERKPFANMKRVAQYVRQTNISGNKMLSSKYSQLVSSKFPVVRCEKLMISNTKHNINNLLLSSTKINNQSSVDSNVENNLQSDYSTSNENLPSVKLNDNKDNNAGISIKKTDLIEGRFDNKVDVNNDTNDVVILYGNGVADIEQKNCKTAVTSNSIVHKDNLHISNNIVSTPHYAYTNQTHNSKMQVMNKGKRMRIEQDFNTDNKTPISKSNMKEEKLSDYLDVIIKALNSVKDDELRSKALQALAECGIGIGKQVPVTPCEQLKTVHDSQIQTDVFGLLDNNSFVLVKEALPTLQRIQQTQHTTMIPPTSNAETQTQTENKIVRIPIDNVDMFPIWNSVDVQHKIDLDNYFNEYFNDNRDVIRVKKALSTPHSLYKKVATQLQKDYENMQQYDENGMLNIHRAVVNDHLQEVQRLLLVSKASNVNIDVLTKNDMTSLELAVKYDVSVSIVKALLEAGAKPVLSKLLHESAVILASKLSSPLLVHLLNYVTDNSLLNRVDSSGFVALHYCALNGNIDGIISLIEAGADVNLRDKRSGRCAVFHALENNHLMIAHKLLQNGATLDLPNFSGQTALNLVDEVKRLLLQLH